MTGLKLQFFTKYTSDDYCVTVWIPSKRVVLNNFLWPGTPNLYTLRGGTYRDPREWRDGLKVIRNLQPEVILTTHTRPVVGKDKALNTLTRYMDQITLEFDQTLRGILLGLGPDDLRYFVKVPPHMADLPLNAETYGEVSFYPPAIYQYAIGWYDRDTTTIHEIAPRDEAERLVALMGGRDKVLAASKSAFDKKEYSWAAQLVNYLYKLDPQDKEVLQVQADALRKLGQLSVGSIPRAFLLSEALALEGKVQIPIMVPPSPTAIAGSAPDFVDYFRVRIDPVKSANADRVVKFVFIGANNKSVGLHIRGGIAEFIDNPDTYYRKPDLTLQLSPETWAKVYLSQITVSDAITSGELKVTQGDSKELVGLFGMFDQFNAAQNVTIPTDMDDER